MYRDCTSCAWHDAMRSGNIPRGMGCWRLSRRRNLFETRCPYHREIAARRTRRLTLLEHVDPLIGSSVTDLPVPQGLAETWWWPNRRSAIPIRARHIHSAWSRRALTPAQDGNRLATAPQQDQNRILLGSTKDNLRDGFLPFADQAVLRWLAARELHRGGHLQVQLGPQPSAWGTRTRPPSASDSSV